VYVDRVRGDRGKNLKKAIELLRQVLEVQTLDAMPAEHRETKFILGNIFFNERNWAEAYRAYASAIAASDQLYLVSATPEARLAELRENRDVSARAAYCSAQSRRYAEAVVILEASKVRAIGEALARNDAALMDAVPQDREAFNALRKRIASLEVEARSQDRPGYRGFLTITTDLREAHKALAAIVRRIRAYLPTFMPAGWILPGLSGWPMESLNLWSISSPLYMAASRCLSAPV